MRSVNHKMEMGKKERQRALLTSSDRDLGAVVEELDGVGADNGAKAENIILGSTVGLVTDVDIVAAREIGVDIAADIASLADSHTALADEELTGLAAGDSVGHGGGGHGEGKSGDDGELHVCGW